MKRIFLSGASSGIGAATAQLLTAAGHEVWGTTRDVTRLTRTELLHPVVMDLRDFSSMDAAFQTALAEAGHFDVVINNAGSGHFGPAEFLPADVVADQVQVLFLAPIHLMQQAMAHMRTRNRGLIINVTSLASRLPVPFMAAYNAAKAAMASFTMSLQVELPASHIRIIDLQPADIFTEFNDRVAHDPAHPEYQEVVAQAWKIVDHNMKTAPKPELVAREILRLIEMNNPPPQITSGAFFQAGIAPLLFRLLPQRTRVWGLKKYYGL
jgi:NAD(P)-dependent dehydrogenase (short-subunit alcohol dehydrogenase family)